MWPELIGAAVSLSANQNSGASAAQPTGDATAQNTFNQTFGGFGDFSVNFGNGSTVSPSHTSTQSPSQTATPTNAAGSGSGSAVPFQFPAWVMPVAIAGVTVVLLGIVVYAVKK